MADPSATDPFPVLFVDDDPDARELLRHIAEHAGAQASVAGSLREARAALAAGEFAAVVTDQHLPDGTGLELVQQLRAERPATDVLIITGYPQVEVAVRALKLGATDYLIKPLDLQLVRHTLAALMDRHRQARERAGLEKALRHADRLRALGVAAAGLAHEINNPLAFAFHQLDQGAGAASLAEARDAMAAARESLERIRILVRDLRLFSRSEPPKLEPTGVRRELELALRMAEPQLEGRAALECALEEVPEVMATAAGLGQVFLNLIANAAQAIPPGQPQRHRVRVSTGTDASGWAVVEVRDTGGGIPPEVRARLFEPFVTTKPPGKGTGLGLAICKAIVDAAGGRIECDSAPGGGTCMRVRLPPAPARAPAPEAAPEPVRLVETGTGRALKLLVVEDEAILLKALTRTCQQSFAVRPCANAADALAAYAEEGGAFDGVLTDFSMPQRTGLDLARQLRREGYAGPVVLLSGSIEAEPFQAALEEGSIQRVLTKPWTLSGLIQELQVLIRDHARPPRVAASAAAASAG
ncbi:MAG TPA: response regulator [Myxococcales bacterium]|nr:response regulator [Myxococcales bacterium]